MLDILATERMKLKHNKLILVCTALAVLLPIIMIAEDVYQNHGAVPEDNLISWVFRLSLLCQLIVYPVLSGFNLTFLIQKEYGDCTIINTLTAPTSRVKFLAGKIIIWAVWHFIITIYFLLAVCVGAALVYGNTQLTNGLKEIIELVLKIGLFNLGTLAPIVWIAVLQRKTFYPSLLCTVIFTGMGFAGLYWPELLGSLLPWSAVSLVSVPGMEVISSLAYVSIFICTILGLFAALYSFKHQEL